MTESVPTRYAPLLTPIAAAFDRLVSIPLTGSGRQRKRRVEAVPPARRLQVLDDTARAYRDARPLTDVDRFFPVVGHEVCVTLARGRWPKLAARGFEVLDARWDSMALTFVDDEKIARRFAEAGPNRRAAARLFRLRRGRHRRVVVLVHGFKGGRYAVEEHLWPVRWWLNRGYDAALLTLPFHGVRQSKESFFTSDPRVTNETLRQAIIDGRALVKWLRADGYDIVGASGMSLGGYTVSLLGTVEPLDLLAPLIPLGSFADSARDGGWLNGTPEEQQAQYEAAERAYAVIDPHARACKVDPAHVLVIAGDGDRITPPSQAERLAQHFNAPCLRFPGGHILQAGRMKTFRALERRLP